VGCVVVGERVVGRQLGAGGRQGRRCGVDEGALVKGASVAYQLCRHLWMTLNE
jgi:hypothetical protein